jgi:hypothetical protein
MRISAAGETFASSAQRSIRRPFSARYRLEWAEIDAASPTEDKGVPESSLKQASDNAPRSAVWRRFILATRESTVADRAPEVTTLDEDQRTVLVPVRSARNTDGGNAPASGRNGRGKTDRRLPMSPEGPLTAEALDLICVPFDPMILEEIVAWQAAAGAARKRLPQAILPALLGFDTVEADRSPAEATEAVTNTSPEGPRFGETVESLASEPPPPGLVVERLQNTIAGAPARVGLRGTVAGAVRGAFTRIGVDGVLELEPNGAALASAVLHIRERREAGFTAPGFESEATIVLSCRRVEQPPPHTVVGDAVARLEAALTGPRPDDDRLSWSDPGGAYRLRYDPRWTPVATGRSLSMRLVDDGALLAEATITPLSGAGATELEDLREDVRRALGERFVGFDTSDERSLPDGSRLLRVVVAAESGSRRFRESHFVLAGPVPSASAEPAPPDAAPPPVRARLAVAVVVDGSLLMRLDEADLRLVEGITLERGDAIEAGATGSSLDGRGDPLE